MEQDRQVAWAVPRQGCTPEQIRSEVDTVLDQLGDTWHSSFPVRQGYLTLTKPLEGPIPGLHLDVMRGDFRAALAVYCDDRANGLVIQAKGDAHSNRLQQAQRRGQKTVRVAQFTAVLTAAAMVLGACWMAVGVQNPVVGGMLLSILSASLIVGGWNFGGRVGESIAERRAARERVIASSDLTLQTDFRRWQALRKTVRRQRRILARGCGGTPFRRAAS